MNLGNLTEDLKTKKVFFGAKTALKQKKKGGVDMIYLASDCPFKTVENLQGAFEKQNILTLEATCNDLREICKKPFSIFVIAVMKGDSKAQAAEKKEKKEKMALQKKDTAETEKEEKTPSKKTKQKKEKKEEVEE
jgi:ribosomal protein L30E